MFIRYAAIGGFKRWSRTGGRYCLGEVFFWLIIVVGRQSKVPRLMHNAENPVFLIWDGHPTHRSKKVKECVDSFAGKLEIYTLPSYLPELNPVEQVWNNVKNHGIGRKKIFGHDQLKSTLLGQLRKLQKLPSLVKSFFRHPKCSYIIA